MTARERAEGKAIAKELDPDFVRRDRRQRAGMFAAVVIALIALVVGVPAFLIGLGNSRDINHIQKTPCTLHPASKACSKIKERIARKGSLKNPCIEHQRVTGEKGANCSQFFIPPIERATGLPPEQATATPAPASTTHTTAAGPPAPGPGKPAGSEHQHGGSPAPAATSPTSEAPAPAAAGPAAAETPAAGSTSPSSSGAGDQAVVPKAGEVLGGTLEGATETVSEATKGVGEVAGHTTCALTGCK